MLRPGPGREAEAGIDAVAVRLPAPRRIFSWLPALPSVDVAALVGSLPIVVVLLTGFLLNFPALSGYFHGDDFVAFTELPQKEPLQYLVDAFTFKDVNFYWRPLGQASYLGLYHLFGLDPVAFHGLSLAMFLATVWLLYRFCINAGLSRATGVLASAILVLLPNHVVSVAWVTNSPRVMAVMLFMLSLVMLQRALRTRSLAWEVAAWLCFLLCPLADETSLALAPVPVLYAAVHSGTLKVGWSTLLRAVAYLAAIGVLAPLQFMFTLDDEPRLADYAFGPHIFDQAWALTSHLVLPLAEGSPLALSFQAIEPVQWAAGGIAIAGGLLLLLLGSWKMRFLALWTAFAIAPFTLWSIEFISPRYVYMAALPYAVLVAWLVVAAVEWLGAFRKLQMAAIGVLAAVGLAAASVGGSVILSRDEEWAQSTEPFHILATRLPEAVPDPPEGTRFIIYYGIWQDFDLWPRVVLRTIYGDEEIEVVSVDRRNVDSAFPRRESRDIIVYYDDGEFFPVPSLATRQ